MIKLVGDTKIWLSYDIEAAFLIFPIIPTYIFTKLKSM